MLQTPRASRYYFDTNGLQIGRLKGDTYKEYLERLFDLYVDAVNNVGLKVVAV